MREDSTSTPIIFHEGPEDDKAGDLNIAKSFLHKQKSCALPQAFGQYRETLPDGSRIESQINRQDNARFGSTLEGKPTDFKDTLGTSLQGTPKPIVINCAPKSLTGERFSHQSDVVRIKKPRGGGAGVGKEVKRERKLKVIIRDEKEWVMLLSIVEDSGNLLGVMVVSQKFNVIRYIKATDKENFDGFRNNNRYYDFKDEWARETSPTKSVKCVLKELPRRSSMWKLEGDYDNTTGDSDGDDGEWSPGPDPAHWWNDIGGFLEYGGIVQGLTMDDAYQVPYGAGFMAYSDTDLFAYHPDVSTVGNSGYYNVAAYMSIPYQIYGLTGTPTGEDNQAHADFGLYNCWEMQWRRPYELLMGIPIAVGPYEVVKDIPHSSIHPYGDPQTREESAYSWYSEPYKFMTDEGDSDVVYTCSDDWRWGRSSTVYAVYSINESSTETVTNSEVGYPYFGDCCSVNNPEDGEPQEQGKANYLAPFTKWSIVETVDAAINETSTYSPCAWSYYWGQYPPKTKISPIPLVTDKITFDDGYKEEMGTHSGNIYPEQNTWDLSIYSYLNKTIYVGGYQYASNDGFDNCLFYYHKGKFHKSATFPCVGATFSPALIDAFDCIAKFSGYWNGRVRVAELTTTTIEELEEAA